MKVPKNQELQAKLMNKIFVKKSGFNGSHSCYNALFLVLALYM